MDATSYTTPTYYYNMLKLWISLLLVQVLKTLKLKESPGPDGLPNGYYKKYADLLIPHLVLYFNHLRDGNFVLKDENIAYISIIPKPHKDPMEISNYRPISLINCDLKMLTKALALRLTSFLEHYIHKDQPGLIRFRQTSDKIRRSLNLITAVHSHWDSPLTRHACYYR